MFGVPIVVAMDRSTRNDIKTAIIISVLFVNLVCAENVGSFLNFNLDGNISSWVSCNSRWSEKLVDCSGKYFTDIPEDVPNNTVILLLNQNQLIHLKKRNFIKFGNLKILDLSYNNLTQIDQNAFEGLTRLEVLNLSYSNVLDYHDQLFTPLTNLKVLNLTRIAQYLKINYNAFENMTKLESLYLERNRLQPFPSFYRVVTRDRIYVPNLKLLHLGRNDIVFLFQNFLIGLENLEVLNLTANRIQVVKTDSLQFAKRLKILILDQNDLSIVCEYGFRSTSLESISFSKSINFELTPKTNTSLMGIPNLRSLNMQGCLISEEIANSSPFDYMIHLTHLDLQGSHIYESYLPRLIGNLKSLEHLSLTDNIIDNLNGDVFENMSGSLKSLHLSKLRLTSITISSLPQRVWQNLREIDLSENPWNCDCNILWFHEWLKITNASNRELEPDKSGVSVLRSRVDETQIRDGPFEIRRPDVFHGRSGLMPGHSSFGRSSTLFVSISGFVPAQIPMARQVLVFCLQGKLRHASFWATLASIISNYQAQRGGGDE